MSRGPRRRRRAPVRKRPRLPGLIGRVLLALLLVVVLGGGWVVWTYRGPGPGAKHGPSTTVVLEHGAGVTQIARALKQAGVIGSTQVFLTAVKVSGAARSLKAGEYEFKSHASMARILADIREGKVVRHWVSVPEGWTSEMVVDAILRQPVLEGPVAAPSEGAVLPDTYQVERGEQRNEVIRRMELAQQTLMARLWATRQVDLPFRTPEEAVTLASIVEKETALPAERPRIAAVYINRLRQGMRLESDPTTIYGISKGKPLGRGLTLSELAAATPYNTYRIDGLPPGPIANPGRAALAAVLDPPSTRELFFVANGQGGHVFASTYEEHQRNVAKWRAVERAHAAEAAK
ncbi:MAG: hypothetical protein JWQ29_2920 [Phenylobacterium sp.]|nr:hypothetical protein [Phenylobacterium sp.]